MRRASACLLLIVVCLLLVGPGAGSLLAAEEAVWEGVSVDELGAWLKKDMQAVFVGFAARFLPLLAGIALLILFVLRQKDGAASPTGIWIDTATPPTAPFVKSRGLFVLGAIVAGATVALLGWATAFPQAAQSFAGQMLSFQLLLVCVAVAVLVGRRLQGARSTVPSVGKKLLAALWTVCIAAVLVVPATLVVNALLQMTGDENIVYGPIQEFMTGADTHRPWLIAFAAVVLAPISEEGVFRGLLYPAFRGQGNDRLRILAAAVLTSAVFAGIHGHVASFLPLFALAMVLNWVFEKTNSLATVMIAHAVWNFLTVLPLLVRIS